MSLDKGMRWKSADENRLRMLSEHGRPLEDMIAQLRRPKKSIRAKLREMDLPEPQPEGVERKCMKLCALRADVPQQVRWPVREMQAYIALGQSVRP